MKIVGILAFLLGIGILFLVFKIGQSVGKRIGAPAELHKRSKLNRDAFLIFTDLCITTDLDRDDVITDETRKRINEWLSQLTNLEKRYS